MREPIRRSTMVIIVLLSLFLAVALFTTGYILGRDSGYMTGYHFGQVCTENYEFGYSEGYMAATRQYHDLENNTD